MDERQKYKTKNPTKHKEINRIIKVECKETWEKWMSQKCEEIEILQKNMIILIFTRKLRN